MDKLEDRIQPAAPIQFFYVPMPEQDTLTGLEHIGSGSQGSAMTSFITIAATENNTVILYDQWEDGYEPNPNNPIQSTSQVWGDGNAANGRTPGSPVGVDNPINAGSVVQLRNDVPSSPRNPVNFFFDGRDLIGADRTVTISRAQFPVDLGNGSTGSVISSAVEVRDTRFYSKNFAAPVGTNTANGGQMFEHTQFFVMAAQDNTVVTIDPDGTGPLTATTKTINQGENLLSVDTLAQGATVVASKPVQVHLLTGDVGSGYASRSYALFSDGQLYNDYFTPVGKASGTNVDGVFLNDPVRLFVYNPNAAKITITFQHGNGTTGTFDVDANSSNSLDVTSDTGTRLFSASNFVAIGVHDTNGTTHDWGFSLQPRTSLSQLVVVGLGVGNSANPPTGSSSPIWVTATQDTTVYVDRNGNGLPDGAGSGTISGRAYDVAIPLTKLTTVRVTDPSDNNASGMRLFTVDGTLLSTTWGEDFTAQTGAPGFDAGTVVPALGVPEFYKFVDFLRDGNGFAIGDANRDGLYNSGDTLQYALRIRNVGTINVTNGTVQDALPSSLTYVVGTTTEQLGTGTPTSIPDNANPTTLFPFDEGGRTSINVNADSTVTYRYTVTINAGLASGTTTITNDGKFLFDIFTYPATVDTAVRGAIGDRVYLDTNANGLDDDGANNGLGGVTVELFRDDDGDGLPGAQPIVAVLTDSTGRYQFIDLDEAKYVVRVAATNANLSGLALSAGTTPRTIALGAGQVVTDADYGYRGTGVIGDLVWNDLDQDGIRDGGEPGLAGAVVGLTWFGADGTPGTADDVAYPTVTTTSTGAYGFSNLPGGKFQASFTPPTGFTRSAQDQGGNDATDSDPNPTTGLTGTITLVSGATDNTVDAGMSSVADLRLVKTGALVTDADASGAGNITATDTIRFSITVTNDGPNPVTSFSVGDLLPTGYSGATAISNGGTFAGGIVSWSGLSLASGASVTLTFNTVVLSAGNYKNVAEVTSSDRSDPDSQPDPTPDNTDPTQDDEAVFTPAITPTSDLRLAKGVTLFADNDGSGAGNVTAGDVVTFAVTVFNDGPNDAANVSVGDVLPSGFSGATAISNGGTFASGVVSWSGLTIPSGGNVVLTFRATVNATGSFTNVAEVTTSGSFDPDSSPDPTPDTDPPAQDDEATTTLTVTPKIDLRLTKTVAVFTDGDGSGNATPGDVVTFTVTVFNDGPNDATGVAVGDVLPGGFSNATTISNGGTFAGGVVSWTGLSIPNGSSLSLTFRATVNASGSYVNVAEVTAAGQFDPDSQPDATPDTTPPTQDDEATATLTVAPVSDLRLTKVVALFTDADGSGAGNVSPGDVVTFTVTVFNDGPNNATGVAVGDQLPSGFASPTNINNGGTFTGGVIAWTGLSIPSGGSVTLTFRATVNASGSYTNVAEVTAAGQFDPDSSPDPTPDTDSPIQDDEATATVSVTPVADLSLTKIVDNATPAVGTNVTYTIVLTNGGPSTATGIQVQDVLPAGVSFVAASDSSYDPGAADNVWNIASLASGGSVSLTIVVRVNVASAGPITNYSQIVAADQFDPDSTPNNASTNEDDDDAAVIAPTAITVGDTVYYDTDANGVQNGTEPGIANVTVTLTYLGANGVPGGGDDQNFTAVTDANGLYSITDLPAGNYTTAITGRPAGATVPTAGPATFVLVTNTDRDDIDFGYRGAGSIGDRVFLDANGNGTYDAGEGIDGVTVTLSGDLTGDGSKDTLTVVTSGDGLYQFTNLRAPIGGLTYTVSIGTADLPKDGTGNPLPNTADPDAGTANQSDVTLTDTVATDTNQDFGYRGAGSIGDRVFLDLNGNGAWDNGEGLTGVTVTLSGDVDADGTVETFTVTTDADGFYQFANLPENDKGNAAISYTVSVGAGLPTGVALSSDPDGGALNKSFTLSLTGNATRTDIDFGYQGTGKLGDRVWIDANGDGKQGPVALEPGLPGVGLLLAFAGQDGTFGTPDDVTTKVVTAQNGSYQFANLPEGPYRVTVDGATVPGNASPTFDVDAPADGVTTVILSSGQIRDDVDFGYKGTASVGDLVWIDQDSDGIRDAAEPGLPGATVVLLWAGPDGDLATAGDNVTFTTMSDKAGLYTFPGLPVFGASDPYRVTVIPPIAGLNPTADPDGPGTPSTADIVVGSGQAFDTADFGYDGTNQLLGGSVYNDLNGNGVRDAAEPGIAGVTLRLVGTDAFGNAVVDPATNNPYFEVTTDATGNYSFTTVVPGTYTITEFQPAAYNDGTDVSGSLGGTAGNDLVGGINVGSGDIGLGYDFGERGAAIAGTVFRDGDRDGIVDAGEPGIGGVTITLLDPANNPVLNPATGQPYVVTTGPDGSYRFENLPAGTYRIVETQPAGYANGPVGPATTRNVTLPLGGLVGQNFAEVLGSVAGTVYVDANINGKRDGGEAPLANVPVTLTGTDTLGNAVNRTVFTGVDGQYIFDNLFPADGTGYTISEGTVAGYVDGPTNAIGNAGGTANGPNQFTGVSPAAGAVATAYDFGERVPGVLVNGSVFNDRNRDGVRDTNEPGIAGVTITLFDAGPDGVIGNGDDGAPRMTATDANGNYTFNNLTPGRTYQVVESQPGAYGDGPVGPARLIDLPNLPAAGAPAQNFPEVYGSLSGSVYFDRDQDGTRDAGEPGIAGTTVTLTGTDVDGNAVNRTATTDANGNYTFAQLPAGLYAVTETQPAGYNDGADAAGTAGGAVGNDAISAVPVGGGANVTGYLFGERGSPISGTSFYDQDRDGTVDAGESGLPGVTVRLVDANGIVVATTVTGPNGSYTFPNVQPGSYTIQEVQPVGYGDPLVGPFAPNGRPVTVGTSPVTNQNFGNTLSTVSGSVFVDANGDGIRSVEPGLGGVIVTLTGTDAAGNPINRTTTTDANGNYSFTDVPASNPAGYTIAESQPAGYADGLDVYGPSGQVIPGSATTDTIAPLTVPAGGDVSGNTFGEVSPVSRGQGGIAGTVYVDRNDNGVQDGGEVGIPGVTVFIDMDKSGTVTAGDLTTFTGPDGTYLFTGLTPGIFTVLEVQPVGYNNGLENPANFANVTVGPALVTGVNFGEVAASVSGRVYLDTNINGIPDGTEAGLGGVTLTLLDGAGNPVANPLTGQPYTAVTDANGNYSFTDLPAGTYRVVETQPAGFTSGTNAVGTGATNPSVAGDTFTLTLGNAQNGASFNFAELRTPTGVPVSGTVYLDADADGTRDPGEPPLAGVTVELLDGAGNAVATAVTGTDGSYTFPSVPPGTYTVREQQPAGYGSSTPNALPITVGATPVGGLNFGETLGSLSGTVYLDANGNGTRQAGEPGLAGVTVVLTGTDAAGNPISRTAITANDGSYRFTNLPAGMYTVTELQPTGFFDGVDVAGSLGGTAGNDVVTGVVLTPGGTGTGYLFAERNPTAPTLGTTFVSGTVYEDPNGNGVRDGNEPGLAGVTIQLVNSNGVVVQTTTTGPDGSYLFIGVPPGNFTVVQPNQPVGYGSTTPNTLPVTVPTSLTPVSNVNFGEARGSISGSVFLNLDNNDNGVRDPSDVGIGGVIVTLTGTDAQGNAVNLTTTTDANGFYTFAGLPPSNAAGYTVGESQPYPGVFGDGVDVAGNLGGTAGNDTITGIAVGAATNGTGYVFSELLPPSNPGTTFIAGTVFQDPDRDGNLDSGETGIGGVTVQLLDSNGDVIASTTTNPDGSYLFPNVPPGSYTVNELQPPVNGSSSSNSIPVLIPNVPNPAPIVGANFGETLGSISGSVFNDFNGNGVRDAGEPGIGGVPITLSGTDVNGNAVTRATTTDANGNYTFGDLPAGTYTVVEATQPAGYADGFDAVGTAGGGTGTNDRFTAIPLGAGVLASDYTFAERGVNSVAGSYYLDFDLNGALTPGAGSVDRPIPNAPVLLVGTDSLGNPITRSGFTDANGRYFFDDLPAGTYRVIQNQDALPTTALPADGVYDGGETVGSLGGSNPANNVLQFTLTGDGTLPAQVGTGYDFGELPPADPFGFVYQDLNGNGIRDVGEPGIAGVTIVISGTAFAGTPFARPLTDADVPGGLTRVTDANGFYEYNPMPPGLYTLTQTTQPAGFLDGQEQNGDPNPPFTVVVGNDNFSNLMLAPLPVRGPFNFGELPPSSLSGTVYLDTNRNGVRDTGEPGIAGVRLNLTGTDDRGNPVSATLITDANGNYTFTGLRPGTYNIAELQPQNLTQGVNQIGSSGGTLVATDIIGQIVLGPGVTATDYVFAETNPNPPSVIRPQPVPPLPPLPPITSVAPGVDLSKRMFLGSTDMTPRVPTERTTPNFAALGSINDTRPTQFISTAEGIGGELIRVFDLTQGQERFRFRPFPGNPGGVRVTTGDVTGDGIPDIIAAAGPGGGPRVIVYDGQNGAILQDFFAFESTFLGGVFVTAADIDGDGRADLVVTPDVGGGPRVRVLGGGDPSAVIADYMGIDDPAFRGGARAAVGDVDGDGVPDIVVGAGVGGGPRVALWSGQSILSGTPTRLVADWFAFESTLRNGVYLTIGDVDGDGFGDVIAGAGPGGSPRVLGFSGASLLAGGTGIVSNYFAGDENDRGGVPLKAVDLDGDGRSEIFTGAGAGAAPWVRFTDPRTGQVMDEFAAEYLEFNGGIHVG